MVVSKVLYLNRKYNVLDPKIDIWWVFGVNKLVHNIFVWVLNSSRIYSRRKVKGCKWKCQFCRSTGNVTFHNLKYSARVYFWTQILLFDYFFDLLPGQASTPLKPTFFTHTHKILAMLYSSFHLSLYLTSKTEEGSAERLKFFVCLPSFETFVHNWEQTEHVEIRNHR